MSAPEVPENLNNGISNLQIRPVLFKTREEWLLSLTDSLRPYFTQAGYTIPDSLYVSCGWPSTRALSTKKRRIGECWAHNATADGIHQIFISPVLADPLEVAETLVHELGHAAVGVDAKHGPVFKSFCKSIGLSGKPTATFAGPALVDLLKALVEPLGAYPNSRLDKVQGPEKKQTTRMLKLQCPAVDNHAEPYILRGSRKSISEGLPVCPCGTEMVAEEPESDDGGE
jgi:hypothetical protein